jgi:hypothetical protein
MGWEEHASLLVKRCQQGVNAEWEPICKDGAMKQFGLAVVNLRKHNRCVLLLTRLLGDAIPYFCGMRIQTVSSYSLSRCNCLYGGMPSGGPI